MMNELLHDMQHLKDSGVYADPKEYIISELMDRWESTEKPVFRLLWDKVGSKDMLKLYVQKNSSREQIEALHDCMIGHIGIPVHKIVTMFNKITKNKYEKALQMVPGERTYLQEV